MIFDAARYQDFNMLLNEAIDLFANAIAVAEGYFVSDSRAQRNHNPGNLTVDTTGTSIGRDGMFIVYGSATDGWDALKKQVSLILTNASQIYNSEMTIYEIAQRYTTTEQLAWAQNVARTLGISPDTKISALLSSAETVGIGLGIVLLFAGLWYFTKKK